MVACKDFREVGEEFYDFISIQNSILEVANGNLKLFRRYFADYRIARYFIKKFN